MVGGYELGATMIKVEKKDDGSYVANELFTTEEFGDQTKPPILHDGYFYAQYGTNNRRDGLVCMNMDGEIMWKTKRDPRFQQRQHDSGRWPDPGDRWRKVALSD